MRPVYLIIALLVCLLAQASLPHRLALGPVQPDFIMVLLIIFALHRGSVQGAILGFIVGFLQDLANPDMLGLNALIKTLTGFAVGNVGSKTFPDNAVILFGLFAAAAFSHDVVYLFFFKWPDVGAALLMIVIAALPSALYTALFGTLLHWLLMRYGGKVVKKALGQEGR